MLFIFYIKLKNKLEFFNNQRCKNIKIYYINLDYRKDRKIFIKEQIKKINCDNIERFPAYRSDLEYCFKYPYIDLNLINMSYGNNYLIGIIGCKISHMNLLQQIIDKNENYKYYIIFEDDCFIFPNVNEILFNSINEIEKKILILNCYI